jgi:hypothetical protein
MATKLDLNADNGSSGIFPLLSQAAAAMDATISGFNCDS